MIRPIVKYGDAQLHGEAAPIVEITADVAQLARDMIDTMHAAPGIGLAAPQVGAPLRLFVIDLSVGASAAELITLINPAFVERDGLQLEEEGCLSVPGYNATVVRPQRAVVRGLDLTGRERVYEGTGLLARAFQHEMDHLEGRLFLDRLRGLRRDTILRKVRRQMRAGTW